MPILDSPGQLVGYIYCRTCHRCAHVDPEMFPAAQPEQSTHRHRAAATPSTSTEPHRDRTALVSRRLMSPNRIRTR
jgi:ferredoxin